MMLCAVQAISFQQDSQMGKGAPAQGGHAPTYSVAKAVLNKAMQLLAADEGFKARGIRVASTCPGWCR
jgi:NAD(P)-dependent dehydrogenase (short-subunit alcohol dehydrogenase family)